ncbi:MAG: hypothetical protein ACI89G_002861 [Minisyncoccia bacterium]
MPVSASSGNGNGTVLVGDTSSASCASGAMTSTYAWRINSYNVAEVDAFFGPVAPQFLIKNAADVAVIVAGTNFSQTCFARPTPYSSVSVNNSTVSLRKRLYINFFGGIELEVPLETDDVYDVGLIRTWQCSGAGSALTAEYRISGTYPGAPTIENVSYTSG